MALQIEEHDLTNNTAHAVELVYTPLNPAEVAVDPFGGPAQVYGVDFLITGKTLDFSLDSSDIKAIVDQGTSVVIRVLYER